MADCDDPTLSSDLGCCKLFRVFVRALCVAAVEGGLVVGWGIGTCDGTKRRASQWSILRIVSVQLCGQRWGADFTQVQQLLRILVSALASVAHADTHYVTLCFLSSGHATQRANCTLKLAQPVCCVCKIPPDTNIQYITTGVAVVHTHTQG